MSISRRDRIESILRTALTPTHLELRDESHLHAGHNADAAAHGETHFRLSVDSPRFAGLTRIEQHRIVNDLLKEEFSAGLHALALTIGVHKSSK